MRVLDAGATVELLIGGLDPRHLGTDDLAAPHLIDSEVTHVLRRLVLQKALSDHEGAQAMRAFTALDIERFSARDLRPRMWELRHTLTGYDATYVALAEHLDADALLTTDARLARAPGPRCTITVL
ncbi:MAG: type II toxin-antitoxin system VapC family toxin [Patulibacter sp.]